MPDRFVDGRDVDWTRLGETGAAAIVIGLVSWVVGVIDLLRSGVETALGGFASFVEELIGAILGLPSSTLDSVVSEVAAFLSGFGILAFPLSIVFALVSGFVMFRAVEISLGLLGGALS